MRNPLFLVDGFLEKEFLQRTCGTKSVIRRIDCNGRDVAMTVIAKRAAAQVGLLKGKCSPIVILIDREGRPESAKDIAKKLHKEMKKHAIGDDLIIGVTDRMIENWILADNTIMGKIVPEDRRNLVLPSYEGKNGKSHIKDWVENYNERVDGVDLLCRSRPSEIRKNSPSFEALFSQLVPIIECNWLGR